MKFQRKTFEDSRAVIISEKPLMAARLEERIAKLVPAFESSIDSFETYLSVYEHCSEIKRVGMFYLHFTKDSTLPLNIIDECALPFESIGCSAGLVIIAEDERRFTDAYKLYGSSSRLLKIVLESDIADDLDLKKNIIDSWQQFKVLQKETALSADELDFITKISSKFADVEPLIRLTNVLVSKLDKNWFEELIVDAGPAILTIPAQQKWVLKNSQPLLTISETIEPYTTLSGTDLILSKEMDHVIRAVVLSYQLYQSTEKQNLVSFLDQLTQGANSFSPTLKKILHKEKVNILDLLSKSKGKIAA